MHQLLFKKAVPEGQKSADGYLLSWSGTAVMGILNVTPDSFSDGGEFIHQDNALAQAKKMINEGAVVIDVGGESTRPGAESVTVQDELDRVLPVIRSLARAEVIISIDTSKPEVAHEAIRAGAAMVNDVTGFRNPEMITVCAETSTPAIIMHMQGKPRTMQQNPGYKNVVHEVKDFLAVQAEKVRSAGVPGIMLDPGYGFGKTLEHNLTLVKNLDVLAQTGYPVLLGASRKSTIHKMANVPDAKERDPGSIALHLCAASKGAAMIRVHNVAAHIQALKVWEALHA